MSVDDLKKALISLSAGEQHEVTAFLFHLRHRADPDYQNEIGRRLADGDRAQWLPLDEFEKRLDRK